ncbi:hypothetical protein Sjap_017449 [Stephania japonica]|uniref:Alcohol dehydrogenase-like C-terminal domain-containing protein n=1 Tax=Stephania japonica TaxID=461633 RepID=A0AAP0NJY2_9MAGN
MAVSSTPFVRRPYLELISEMCDIGKKFGVTDFINPEDCGDKPVSEVIAEMTDGGVDYCFECVGLVSLVYEAYASCRKGWGKAIVVGVDTKSYVSISSYDILHSGKVLMGSLFGNIKAKTDIPYLLKLYMEKVLYFFREDPSYIYSIQYSGITSLSS